MYEVRLTMGLGTGFESEIITSESREDGVKFAMEVVKIMKLKQNYDFDFSMVVIKKIENGINGKDHKKNS